MNKWKCLLDQLFDSSVPPNNIIEAGSPLRTPHPGGYKPTHRISLCHHHSSTLLISLNVPPRSPRCRLGGLVILPRMLDKGRATVVAEQGAYHYNCPLDQRLLNFLGVDPDGLMSEIKLAKGDGELLEWILENANNKIAPWNIEQRSAYQDKRSPDSDAETILYFAGKVGNFSKTREDIKTWFDLLDLDDHASFGGKP